MNLKLFREQQNSIEKIILKNVEDVALSIDER